MANWVINDQRLGLPQITDISASSTPAVPPGTIVRATDTTGGASTTAYGIAGEFIYLAGVGSTTAGNLMTYNPSANTTTLCPSTAGLAQPVCVAMSANTGVATYGWYQIAGVATIKKTAIKVSPNVAVWISGTAGRIFATATTGKQVLGARTVNAATIASATSTVLVLLNRPHAQGQII